MKILHHNFETYKIRMASKVKYVFIQTYVNNPILTLYLQNLKRKLIYLASNIDVIIALNWSH